MNRIITDKEEIVDSDALEFYAFLSQFISKTLDSQKDNVALTKPPNTSRNSKDYLVYCDINNERRIAFKRCSDIPEFIRRELSTAKAQRIVGFSSYKVEGIQGIVLRNKSTNRNCKILAGWEDKVFLAIDYGNLKLMKTLRSIKKDEIDMLEFFSNYGKWCAFNCLLGVRDRHDMNFVVSSINEIVYSVDNEEGPFDIQNNLVDIRLIVNQLKSGVERFFVGNDEPLYKERLRQGFVDGWNQIASKLSSLDFFNKQEYDLLRNSIASEPEVIFRSLFY